MFEQARDDNYKVALQGDPLDLRTNFLKEKENDKEITNNEKSWSSSSYTY